MNPRLSLFMSMVTESVYPEPPSEPHISITNVAIQSLIDANIIKPDMRILDVGCGQGGALEIFNNLGLKTTGITLGPDFTICLQKGLNVFQIDQNNMSFDESSFDIIWARHVLEHSPIPLFTLFEYKRLLRTGGILYVEVPAPMTFARHEFNENHYSVLTPTMWVALFKKAGFKEIESYNTMEIRLPAGIDTYYNFFLEKEAAS